LRQLMGCYFARKKIESDFLLDLLGLDVTSLGSWDLLTIGGGAVPTFFATITLGRCRGREKIDWQEPRWRVARKSNFDS